MIRIEGATIRELDVLQTALSMLTCQIETKTTHLRQSDIQRMGPKVCCELKVQMYPLDETQQWVVDHADAMRQDILALMNGRGGAPSTQVHTPGPAEREKPHARPAFKADPFENNNV